MVDALYMRNVLSTRDKDALVAQMVCNKDSESCSYRLCDECVGKNSLIPSNIVTDTVYYSRWERGNSGDHVATNLVEVKKV